MTQTEKVRLHLERNMKRLRSQARALAEKAEDTPLGSQTFAYLSAQSEMADIAADDVLDCLVEHFGYDPGPQEPCVVCGTLARVPEHGMILCRDCRVKGEL